MTRSAGLLCVLHVWILCSTDNANHLASSQTMPCGVAGLGDVYKVLMGLLPWPSGGGGGGMCARRIDYTSR